VCRDGAVVTINCVPPVGPVDARVVPRYAGLGTFARLPERSAVPEFDVAVLGIPFDTGVSYRPGARFGPQAVRQASRLLRPYHPGLDVEPFAAQQVVDAGDVGVTPFEIAKALTQIEAAAAEILATGARLVSIGGDHTIALPLLRAMHKRFGPVALIHFDAHLDTWDTHFGQRYTHGSPFRRAAEEVLFLEEASIHVGLRGPLFTPDDLRQDADLGFKAIHCAELEETGVAEIAGRIADRIGDRAAYVSIDIDVLDPAFAPGTGTPEAGGMTARELLGILRRLGSLRMVSADVVEVAPAYDHAEITGIAAAHVVYELISLMAKP
jgi:agmatinase